MAKVREITLISSEHSFTFSCAKNARMNTHEVPADLITPKEAATLLHVHQATLYRLIADGRLPCWTRAGTRKFVSKAAVLGLFAPSGAGAGERRPSHQESVDQLKQLGWL